MSLFSLDWFKSNKKKNELEIKKLELEIKQQELAVKSEEIYQNRLIQEEPNVKEEREQLSIDDLFTNIKPYLNIKLVNDVLTVVLSNGDIVSKPGASTEDFKGVRNAQTEDEILDIISTPEIAQEMREKKALIEKQRAIMQGIDLLKHFEDFEVKDGSVYFKGINRTLPQILVEEFLSIISSYPFSNTLSQSELNNLVKKDEKYQALKRFFMWCCLNPRAEVVNELYRFLKDNSFRITKQGFFVALRNVVTLHGSNELVQFVSNAYNKVKAVWKKSPADYFVFLENGQYKMIHKHNLYNEEEVECSECDGTGLCPYDDDSEECVECDATGIVTDRIYQQHGEKIGNLTEIYLDLPNRTENRFTDDWTKTFDIRIGKVVNMPMEQCNWSTQDCAAAGLICSPLY